jgi:hypothetical protein
VTIPSTGCANLWTVCKIHDNGHVTVKRTPDPWEQAWGGYADPHSTMKKQGTEVVYIEVASVDHLEPVIPKIYCEKDQKWIRSVPVSKDELVRDKWEGSES